MKAIRAHQFGDPSVMKLEEVPEKSAGAGQVLVDVKAAGVNPVDTYIRSGQYASLPPLPYTPGADAAGVVAAVGSDVQDFKKGDRVYISGTIDGRAYGSYAQRAVCTVDQVHHLPDHVSFAEGAGVGIPYVTAWRALFDKGRAAPGETVLIHGASGAVGVAATQIASAAGLRVFGTAGTERGRQLAHEQGAREVFDHSAPGYEKDVLAKTGGRGVDLIIEMLANVNLVKDLDLIAKRGRISIVGNRGALELNPRAIMAKDATVVGFTNWNALPAELATAHAAIVAGMERSGFKPQVGKELPLADAARAHEEVLKPGAYGKIVLIP
ncbi:MAG: quinone oxidoreductase [Verrucomicrobia bacterium RIFCSPLOWO2_12_FULL_64_8]|nr:MAG: quinone oxidoreductase [Verrucomicrobia bacterium RIFCSPLOWO2_12_FULL_64_8]